MERLERVPVIAIEPGVPQEALGVELERGRPVFFVVVQRPLMDGNDGLSRIRTMVRTNWAAGASRHLRFLECGSRRRPRRLWGPLLAIP